MAKKGRKPEDDGSPHPGRYVRVRRLVADMSEAERRKEQAVGIGTEIARLVEAGRLPKSSNIAAVMAARVIGDYDAKILGMRRFPKCAAYTTGRGGGPPLDEDRMTPDERKEHERVNRRIKKDFELVDSCIETADERRVFTRVVLENEMADCTPDVGLLAAVLSRMAQELRVHGAVREGLISRPKQQLRHPRVAPRAPGAPRPVSREKLAFLETVIPLGLEPAEAEAKWLEMEARRDRARFRSDKERASATP